MSYYTRHRSIPYMGSIIIIALLFAAMTLRCTPRETAEQMQKDISGMDAERRVNIMKWQDGK